jgi:hypothetical protein
MKTCKKDTFLYFLAIIVLVFAFIACNDGTDSNQKITPPSIGSSKETAIQLTLDTWTIRELTTENEQWFKFIATADPQYLHINLITLVFVQIQLYDHEGISLKSQAYIGSGILVNFSQNVTVGQTYYIKIGGVIEDIGWIGGNEGIFKIAFNTSDTPPAIQLPTTGITELILNTWVMPESSINGELWFYFTATTDTQYIHINIGSVTCYVQLYDNSGNALCNNIYARVLDSANYISQTVTVGQIYYFKATTSSTAFQLGLTESDIPPKIQLPNENVVPLTMDTWEDGYFDNYDDDQWFSLTATAASQYVHFSFGTLRDLTLRVYNDNGEMVYTYQQGASYRVYSYENPTAYNQMALSISQKYYLRVRPYGSGNTFKIAFNENSTPPSE